MSRIVEHLADLTGFRDRDVLDVTLVGALKDLLRLQAVAIYRCVGEVGQERWLTRARLAADDTTATADPLWADPATLPRLNDHPDRHACLQRQESFTVDGSPTMAYFPLTTDREPVGVLELQTLLPLSHEEVRLVCSILRIYRNFQGLLDYSERDTLTGLLNRKTFDESFLRVAVQPPQPAPQQRSEARRLGPTGGSWLGVIDIDHFKRVNDTHGHLIGDEVLLLLSRLMRTSFRFHDHLYRFGGEEFVVLMRCGSPEDAAQAFERLRSNVERYIFPQVGQITVSVGFSELRPGDSPSSAFERADKAVYYAKENGRNQVAHHAELVATGKLSEETHDAGDVEFF
ncbi:MAG: GGDEF domain-containing protein [Rubrivivax sp.]|nr:GGDEF domain-containing protein [Rubrivivax sp.]